MRRTLLIIPNEVFGLPLISSDARFGWGLLLAVTALLGLVFIWWRARREGFGPEARSNLIILAAVCAGIVLVAPRLLVTEDGVHGLPIRGYGVMLLFAVLAAVFAAVRRAKQVGLAPDVVLSVAFWVFIFGIAGARLLYVVRHLDRLANKSIGEAIFDTFNVAEGGLVVYGGLIGGALGFTIFCLKNKIKLLPFADVIAASLVIGQAIGRLGCLMNGCCFGGVCDLPYTAVTFPWHSNAHTHQAFTDQTDLFGIWLDHEASDAVKIRDVVPGSPADVAGLQPGGLIVSLNDVPVDQHDEFVNAILDADPHDSNRSELKLIVENAGGQLEEYKLAVPAELPRSQPVYPTQIYGFINGTLFFLFAWFLFPFRRRDGEVFAALLLMFPVTRFLMEVIRTDEPQNFFLGLTISQTISLGLSLCGVALWAWLLRQPKRVESGPEFWAPVNARFAVSP